MIYIVIDNAPFPAAVVGVYKSEDEAVRFMSNSEWDKDEDDLSLVKWDIVNNRPIDTAADNVVPIS